MYNNNNKNKKIITIIITTHYQILQSGRHSLSCFISSREITFDVGDDDDDDEAATLNRNTSFLLINYIFS